ncbi:hypothetical protein CC80DRAFT_77507 [Byssothecium circinans]|uniref:Uncharacterized protein n=1 Tax=Byssothecium circinans TaxID=147558 RepID=A0A6A5TTS7_9PLEO|nr:hypothetical protein CC80DRAFT_77507 [Byssothecium circinans]
MSPKSRLCASTLLLLLRTSVTSQSHYLRTQVPVHGDVTRTAQTNRVRHTWWAFDIVHVGDVTTVKAGAWNGIVVGGVFVICACGMEEEMRRGCEA